MNNMNKFGPKTLEQTIKELQQKYKNVPSPLSNMNGQMPAAVVPQQKIGGPRANILGDFRPQPKSW